MPHSSAPHEFVAKLMTEWKISASEMAKILSLPEAKSPQMLLDCLDVEQSTRLPLILRLYQSLDSYFDGNRQTIADWLRTPNLDLEAAPITAMETERGLRAVCEYVDAFRFR